MLNITISSVKDKTRLRFVLATVYRPPGHHTDFIKEFADFLSELVLAADKALIVGDFNIHVDNEKDALGLAFNLLTRTRTWTLSELFVCTCHCFQTDKVKQDKMNLDKLYIILKV